MIKIQLRERRFVFMSVDKGMLYKQAVQLFITLLDECDEIFAQLSDIFA